MEDAVGHLKGVSKAKFGGIAPQKLDVTAKNGEWVDLEEIWKLIRKQGYSVRKENTHITLRGTANKVDESWYLTLSGGGDSKRIPIEVAAARNGYGALQSPGRPERADRGLRSLP